MELIKSMSNKIFIGLTQGVGFGIIFSTFTYYASNSSLEDVINAVHDNTRLEKILILDLKKIVRDKKMLVLGNIKNNNPDEQRILAVQVDFFYKDVFVEQCRKNILGTLKPNEIRNFKISCNGIVEHDRYEVYLLNNARR